MKLTRTATINPALFSVIPLVNVLFLVLVFFGLSSRFTLQAGIAVSLPFSAWTLGSQRNPQILSISSAPVPTIYFRDQKLAAEDLPKALRDKTVKDRTLIIRADRSTPYDFIMRVINEGLQAGFSVVLATSPEHP
jgi:biopolymer transport protein ExbD